MDDLTSLIRPASLDAILADAQTFDFRMSCDERTGALLSILAASKPGGQFLELGTGVGAGAAWISDGMDIHSSLITVERDADAQMIARKHLWSDEPGRSIFFMHADVDHWLDTQAGREPAFDLVFVDCRPGKYRRMADAVALLKPGGFYVGDDLLPQETWPEDHQERVDRYLEELPSVANLRPMTLNWASGLVLGVRT
ncbi:O-methyltransferase [Streptomyces sp. NPDC054838]